MNDHQVKGTPGICQRGHPVRIAHRADGSVEVTTAKGAFAGFGLRGTMQKGNVMCIVCGASVSVAFEEESGGVV